MDWTQMETAIRTHYTAFTGEELGERLGCGHQGIVFRGRPGTAVKLTDEVPEATFFMWLAAQEGHPGLPIVYRAGNLGLFDFAAATSEPDEGQWYLYAIEREDVPDLVLPCPNGCDTTENILRFHFCVEDIPRPKDLAAQTTRARAAAKVRDFLPVALKTLPPIQHQDFADLLDCVAWMVNHGCEVDWMHEGNLGRRDHRLVIRDHSKSRPPAEFDPLALHRPYPLLTAAHSPSL